MIRIFHIFSIPLSLTFFLLLSSIPVQAVPPPEGIAVNAKKNLCTNFTVNTKGLSDLPKDWKLYYRNFDDKENDYYFVTPNGSCVFDKYKSFNQPNSKEWKKCYQTVGCDYVKYNEFNLEHRSVLANNYNCGPLDPSYANQNPNTVFVVDSTNNACTIVWCDYIPGEDPIKDAGGLTIYHKTNRLVTFDTDLGSCKIIENGNDYSECCSQLGARYLDAIQMEQLKQDDYENYSPSDGEVKYLLNRGIPIILVVTFLLCIIIIFTAIYSHRRNDRQKLM
jgi:hypothetical protein